MTERENNTPKDERRLKRWSIAQKYRIVEETFVPGVSVALVARYHNVNANQVFGWRKQYRQGILVDRKTAKTHDLIRVGVVDALGKLNSLPLSVPSVSAPPAPVKVVALQEPRLSGIIEIEWHHGIKVRVDAHVDDTLLRRVLVLIKDVA